MSLKELSKYTITSKYAKYLPEQRRRETWSETVERCRNMHLKKYDFLSDADLKEIETTFEAVKRKEVAPSMRSLQFGGEAIERKNARMYNCFKRDTPFVTKEGVKTFEDYNDGDSVVVLTAPGNWKKAVVRNYGEDSLYLTSVRRGKSVSEVYVTNNHRWLLKDGSDTTSLKVGDKLLPSKNIFSEFDYDNATPEERLYWCYGFVYGDGTKIKDKKGEVKYSLVRLCGKDSIFASRFIEMGFKVSTNQSLNGDFFAYTGSYLKTSPNPEKDSPEMIRAFVSGYLQADGQKNKNRKTKETVSQNPFITIQSSELDHIDFIRTCFPVAGVFIVSETELTGQKTNYGVRPYTVNFRVISGFDGTSVGNFVVDSISEDYLTEDVWCLEVEDDSSFVFPNGLTTGNCSVAHIYDSRSIEKAFWLLLCGCGVGLGFTKKFADRFPKLLPLRSFDKEKEIVITIPDTIEGWANSTKILIDSFVEGNEYSGKYIRFDYSQIRDKGEPLSIGGKAPGFEGLRDGHIKINNLIWQRIKNGATKLRTIDLYDIMMHCSDAVLSGGIRRSATLALFDLDDEEMMNAKTEITVSGCSYQQENISEPYLTIRYNGKDVKFSGKELEDITQYDLDNILTKGKVGWYIVEPQRKRSNNSVMLKRDNVTEQGFKAIFDKTKQFGEPGFVWVDDEDSLYNPCAEIGFIPVINDEPAVQFCNLSIINGTKITTKEDLMRAVEYATIIGTLQAGYTDFAFLDEKDRIITEEEALLGVSILGFMANADILLTDEIQKEASALAVKVNEKWAKKIGINPASRVTCVKPDGNSAAALESPFSGIHPAHSPKYIRRVQANTDENLYQHFNFYNSYLCEPSLHSATGTDDVISFPIEVESNGKVIFKKDLTAIEHLEIIKGVQQNWVLGGQKNNKKAVSNSVSCTVLVKEDEWEKVAHYIYQNKEFFATVSLLSDIGDKVYPQAPYESIQTQEELELFEINKKKFIPVDYTLCVEETDNTARNEEAACFGGACAF